MSLLRHFGWAPIAVLATGVVFVAGGRMFFLLDAVYEHGSFQRIVSRCLSLDPAAVPGWNPWMFCGTPLFADPQMHVAYPPALLYRFLPHAVAAGAFVWLHMALAAAGMTALLAGRGLGGWAATTGALTYALGGMPFLLAATPACLTGYAWIPWIAGWAMRPAAGRTALLVVGFAWLILAGLPQAVLYGAIAAGLGASVAGGRRGRRVGGVAVGFAGGAALAAVVLVPFLHWVPFTTRAVPLAVDSFARDDLRPAHLLSFMAPYSFALSGGSGVLDNRHLWPTFNFIGTLPLLLATVGLLVPAGRRGAGPAVAFVVAGTVLALGAGVPVAGPLLHSIPPFSFIRRSALWMMLADLGLAWLAARGVALLVKRAGAGRGPRIAAGIAALTLAELLVVGFAAQPGLPAAWVEESPTTARWLEERSRREWFRVLSVGGHDRAGVTTGADIRDALVIQHARMAPNLLAGAGLRDADGVNPLRGAAIDRRLAGVEGSITTQALLGIRYLVSAGPLPGRGAPLLRDRALIYRTTAARPLAWIEPANAGEITDEPIERPGCVSLGVRLAHSATVVINQVWSPGWALDPPSGTLAPYDDVLIAVRLTAGTHAVSARYRTPGLQPGAAISAGALAVLLWLGLRRRRQP